MSNMAAELILLLGLAVLAVILWGSGGLILAGSETGPGDPSFEEMLGLAASAVGTGLLLWWTLSLVLAFAGELLARCGFGIAGSFLTALSPAFMRRLAVAVLGINFLAAPVAQAAPAANAGVSVAAAEAASPLWQPVEAATGPAPIDPLWKPAPAAPDGGLMVRAERAQNGGAPSGGEVVVKPGHSLWSIAAEHLGVFATDAEIAQAWPAWYDANRDVIGNDPSLLQPGQILRQPDAS